MDGLVCQTLSSFSGFKCEAIQQAVQTLECNYLSEHVRDETASFLVREASSLPAKARFNSRGIVRPTGQRDKKCKQADRAVKPTLTFHELAAI